MVYKKGQQIRMTERRVGLDLGEVFTLTEDGERAVFFDSEGDWRSRTTGFELVSPKWEPKVGDRVVWREEFKSSLYTKGKTYEIKSFEHSNFILTDDAGSPRHTWTAETILENFDLAPPATITIQTGRYYKTRDGRKVGPMVKSAWGLGWYDRGLLVTGQRWEENGQFIKGEVSQLDIISLWQDEPAVVATVTNTTPPKFKVGNRVRFKNTYLSKQVRGVEATVIAINPWGVQIDSGSTIGVSTENPQSIELIPDPQPSAIVALIENDQPKPATRPVIHASQADATKEAERLALLHAGQEFGVFVLADSKIADVVEETVKRTVLRAA
ncbi:hypothetical protein [Rhizobium rhizogenes]|uniref:hypothetical protein n=1 Tax=Rhizobium rhizogenes TaxID=359 RepID=UPI0004D7E1B4|nr:hypothetical protein [Rhizobium rhizogenes]KEA07517.1 hypothetical protein CN09_11505 [Rhizobium rhizogenes]NTJ22203.1 hypothetical protein [Rhizobium rhizogenes]QUE80922.1 hypothetical protein EML492_03685 [Rhizobium rhizogenes]TQO80971.1 hypothetical protein FFE80_07715 [Rhizobium rhizogenes]TRB51565.1 hypothetical protein EXN69_26600 [Rhizobium rhizogenes]